MTMELEEFQSALATLADQAEEAFSSASDAEAFEAARVRFAGARSGEFKALQKQMGSLAKEDRKSGGMQLNATKQRHRAAPADAQPRLRREGARGREAREHGVGGADVT